MLTCFRTSIGGRVRDSVSFETPLGDSSSNNDSRFTNVHQHFSTLTLMWKLCALLLSLLDFGALTDPVSQAGSGV